MTEYSTVGQRAAAGAAWLDGRVPGWVDLIDLSLLDMGHCESCVLGQLLGRVKGDDPFYLYTYYDVVDPDPVLAPPLAEYLGIEDALAEDEVIELGFYPTDPADLVELRTAWVALIGQRQEVTE